MVQVRFRMSHEREGPAGGRHRRRHRAAVAAPNRVTMSVLLTVLTGLAAGCSPTGSATPAQPLAPSATQSASAPAPGTWRRIAAAPIPPAGGMAAAWTGRQLVVWGGQSGDGRQPAGDGAAYDPGADRWEVLAPAPIAARFGATAVWTGREVLFWGGHSHRPPSSAATSAVGPRPGRGTPWPSASRSSPGSVGPGRAGPGRASEASTRARRRRRRVTSQGSWGSGRRQLRTAPSPDLFAGQQMCAKSHCVPIGTTRPWMSFSSGGQLVARRSGGSG
jgi:hypothetical protein